MIFAYKSGENLQRRVCGVTCTNFSCTRGPAEGDCPTCGFCLEEIERRKNLPLIEGPDGLRRKYTGIRNRKPNMEVEEGDLW